MSKFCSKCGKQMEDSMIFCDNCGAVANNNFQPVKAKYNTMSVIGIIVAGISLLLNFWGIVGIAAVILSSLGLMQVNKTYEKGKGLAITGIIIGAFSIIYGVAVLLTQK